MEMFLPDLLHMMPRRKHAVSLDGVCIQFFRLSIIPQPCLECSDVQPLYGEGGLNLERLLRSQPAILGVPTLDIKIGLGKARISPRYFMGPVADMKAEESNLKRVAALEGVPAYVASTGTVLLLSPVGRFFARFQQERVAVRHMNPSQKCLHSTLSICAHTTRLSSSVSPHRMPIPFLYCISTRQRIPLRWRLIYEMELRAPRHGSICFLLPASVTTNTA